MIKQIKESFVQINSDKTLKTIKLDNEDFTDQATDGGSSLTGFVRGDTIFKITAWIGLSVCNKQYEFYFDEQNQLFFIYEQENDFPEDGSGGLNYNRTELAFEGRYYLNNGKLIDIKTKGVKRIGGKPDAAFIKSLIDDSRSYSKLIIARINKK